MTKHRVPSKKSKYYLPKETFLTVVHYCKQYPLWVAELSATLDTGKAIQYDKDRVQMTNDSDPTFDAVVKREIVSRKKDIIDRAALDAAGDLADWIILGTCHDMPYYKLQMKGIPCGKDLYYLLRRRFYYEVSKRI